MTIRFRSRHNCPVSGTNPSPIAAIVDEAHRKNILVAAHVESTEGVLEALRAGVDTIEHGALLTVETIALFHQNPRSLRGFSTLHATLSVLGGGVAKSSLESDNPGVRIMSANAELIGARLLEGFKDALELCELWLCNRHLRRERKPPARTPLVDGQCLSKRWTELGTTGRLIHVCSGDRIGS